MNPLPVDRALSIYETLADRSAIKGTRERLSQHLMKIYLEGEKDPHRLTVHGLSYLRDFDRKWTRELNGRLGGITRMPALCRASTLILTAEDVDPDGLTIALTLQRGALLSQRIPARDFRFRRVNLFRSRRAFSRLRAFEPSFPCPPTA